MEEDDRQRGDDSSRKNEIDVQLHSAGRASEVTLHYMPFLIDYEGEAPIQNYFVVESERVKLEEEGSMSTLSTSTSSSSSSSASAAPEDDILRASFRGRLLRGKTLPLPSDYQGTTGTSRCLAGRLSHCARALATACSLDVALTCTCTDTLVS